MAMLPPVSSRSVGRMAFLGALVAMVLVGLLARERSTQVLVPLEVPSAGVVK